MGIVSRGLGDCVDVRLSNRSELIKLGLYVLS